MKHIKTFESFINKSQLVKEAIDSRSIGSSHKIGFNFFSLRKGDEIQNKKTKKTWIVQSVGSDGADLKDKWLGKYLTITSLKDWEPVNVKAMDESYTNSLRENRQQKFLLYTNPNNATNFAYIAWGNEVKEVLKDQRDYPGSYKILYQGRGTDSDAKKIASDMFSYYKFNI